MTKDAKNKEVKNTKHFFKDFKAELKKVIWPTPKQIVNNTIAVVTIVIVAAAIVFVLDWTFNILNDKGINRLKSNLRSKNSVEDISLNENLENNEETSNTEITTQDGVIVETTPVNSVEDNNNTTVNESSTENVQ